MLAEGRVGQSNIADGSVVELRLTRTGGAAVANAHARYWDAVVRGNVFLAAQQSASALGTALTATAVTLTLWNPPGSGRNLVLMRTTLAIPVATTAGQVVYAVNGTVGQAAPTATTDLASGIQNALVGGAGASPVARVFSAATLPAAPVARRVLAGIISVTPGGVHTIVDDVDGEIIIAPNGIVTIQGITTNATGQIGLSWEEVSL